MGVKVTTIGVLFKKADKTDIGRKNRSMKPKFDRLFFNHPFVTRSIIRLFWTAPTTINSKAIVNIPSFEKPLSASFGEMMPLISNIIRTVKIIVPGRAISNTKLISIKMIKMNKTIISVDIYSFPTLLPLHTIFNELLNESSQDYEYIAYHPAIITNSLYAPIKKGIFLSAECRIKRCL